MERITGIFQTVREAERAVEDLRLAGVEEQSIILLSNQSPNQVPAAKEDEVRSDGTPSVSNKDTGKKMGAAVGGTLGATAGFTAGATAAALLVPGLGTIFAIGIGAAAALGLGGIAAGAKVGDGVEKAADPAIPKDEIDFYHALLKQQRSVVVVNADSPQHAARAQEILRRHGSEDSVAARARAPRAA